MIAPKQPPRVQIILDLSPELYETIKNLETQMNEDTTEVLLKALALLEIAVEAKTASKHLWITDAQQNLETQIIGI
jgi:hypothetical protein